jgi:O-succinylbenzoic acid--CoA ligase
VVSARPWVETAAARAPNDLALRFDGRDLSFAELAREARRGAAALAAEGVGPGDRVALALPACPAFVEALHACWWLGAAVVPLSLRLPAAERAAQLSRTTPRLLVEDPSAWERAKDSAAAVPPPWETDLASDAVVIFSSGTAAAPKAVRLGFGNLRASAEASAAHLGAPPGERWLACLPLHHVGGLSILVRSAVSCAAVMLQDGFAPARVNDALDGDAISAVSLVPTTLKRLLDHRGDRPAPPGLRFVLLGGAVAPAGLLTRAREAGWPVLPTYGLTEAASQVATVRPGSPHTAGVGPPLPGTAVRILGGDGAPLPVGEEGEIAVRSPTVFAGYLGDDAASRRALRGGWLHTGDIGILDPDGHLHVLDRRTDLIVTGGENVSPAAVEAVLLEHPAVDEVAVTGLPDEEWGQRVAAWVVLRPGRQRKATELEAHCRKSLVGYEVPRAFRIVEALPRNAMGKVVRQALVGLDGVTPPPAKPGASR